MAKTIKALYANGVFKPLTKVRLKNHQQVELAVVERKKPMKSSAKLPHRGRANLREVSSHPAYRIVGLFKSGLHNLSKHHDRYLYPDRTTQ